MPQKPLTITATAVQKRYRYRPVFDPITMTASAGEIIAITGANGAGKSTLLKMLAGVLTPSKGTCSWQIASKDLDNDAIRTRLGFVAPYLELYGELSALEHMQLVAEMKGKPFEQSAALKLLGDLGLKAEAASSSRQLKEFSSGMKQRVRIAMALQNDPEALMLDEPTNNLDEDGAERALALVTAAANRGAIVIIATNETRERAIANREIRITPAV